MFLVEESSSRVNSVNTIKTGDFVSLLCSLSLLFLNNIGLSQDPVERTLRRRYHEKSPDTTHEKYKLENAGNTQSWDCSRIGCDTFTGNLLVIYR